ncbi:hypothetical protein WJX81_001383 [Elliptochloris bilobata]|uniref:Uncharacterized protein n=1 Tax=Elliptochloris bilobata TaxID=381761 RepID=A0AAW1RUE5_9CHLO
MEKLLAQAAPRGPRSIKTEDGGALLALSLHCLMCQQGFTPARRRLAEDWNKRFTDEWVFEYRRAGCKNTFVLHCSLQAASGKMFVNLREDGNSSNTHCVGLLLSRYVKRPALASPDWRGLPAEAEALEGMFTTYVTAPLLASAVPSQGRGGYAASLPQWLAELPQVLHRREVYIPLAVVATAAVVFFALRQRPNVAQNR